MKKIKSNIIALTLLVSSFYSFSQKEIKLGVKAGVNFSKFIGNQVNPAIISKNEFVTGFQIGVISSYEINKIFSLQTEIIFNQQGNKAELNDFNPEDVVDPSINEISKPLKINYLCLPIFLKTKIFKNATFDSGIQYSYMINSSDLRSYNDENVIIYIDESSLKKNDFSFNLGMTYDLSEKLFLQLKNNFSILKIDNGNSMYGKDLKNLCLQFSLGYYFK